MASTAACRTVAPVSGLCGASLAPHATRVQLKSGFVCGSKSSFSGVQIARPVSSGRVTCFVRDWLRTDLSVIGFSIVGWLAPSSIPAINGNSLTGLFFGSIGPELAHFPTPPALDSPFWLWMVTWHLGLFIALTLGQIGFKGRNDGYF